MSMMSLLLIEHNNISTYIELLLTSVQPSHNTLKFLPVIHLILLLLQHRVQQGNGIS